MPPQETTSLSLLTDIMTIVKSDYVKWKERIGEEKALAIRRARNFITRNGNPEQYLLYEAKGRAKKKGLEFSLTKEDIKIPKFCPVLGMPLFPNKGTFGGAYNSPSVDCFDNSKGYTKDNIRIISLRANRLKNDATIKELENVLKYMKEYAPSVV